MNSNLLTLLKCGNIGIVVTSGAQTQVLNSALYRTYESLTQNNIPQMRRQIVFHFDELSGVTKEFLNQLKDDNLKYIIKKNCGNHPVLFEEHKNEKHSELMISSFHSVYKTNARGHYWGGYYSGAIPYSDLNCKFQSEKTQLVPHVKIRYKSDQIKLPNKFEKEIYSWKNGNAEIFQKNYPNHENYIFFDLDQKKEISKNEKEFFEESLNFKSIIQHSDEKLHLKSQRNGVSIQHLVSEVINSGLADDKTQKILGDLSEDYSLEAKTKILNRNELAYKQFLSNNRVKKSVKKDFLPEENPQIFFNKKKIDPESNKDIFE